MSKIALLFPGQGAQHIGMGKTLIERFPKARELFDRASEILKLDLAKICAEGPADKLDATNIAQPALFVSSLAALELLKEQVPGAAENCVAAAGLSLGEYSALVFAGVMSFDDGLRVVKVRGEAMQAAAEANPSGMVSALRLEREQVIAVRDGAQSAGPLWIANYLCPGNTVLSGSKAGCAKAAELIAEQNGMAIPLSVAGAFHTPLMESACAPLRAALESVSLSKPRIPVISNVDAAAHDDPEEIRSLLVRQVVQPVLWDDSMRALVATGIDQFYEVGPGRVLKGLLKRVDRKLACESINDSPA